MIMHVIKTFYRSERIPILLFQHKIAFYAELLLIGRINMMLFGIRVCVI